ncbi:unnamed protein product [Agarophyton chilense]
MNFLFSPSQRNAGIRTFVAPFTAPAFTIFGVRVSRDHILRLSAILTLRTLLSIVDLPLEETASAYLASLLSSITNVTVFLALTSNYFHFEGLIGRIGSFIFPSSRKPSAFVTIYSKVVFVLGPVVSWLETAVITYEIMRIARRWETRMQRAQAQASTIPRRLLLALAFFCLVCTAAIATFLGMCHAKYAAGAVTACLSLLSYSFFNDDANIVEASLLCLYTCSILVFGWLESQSLSDEARATLLIITVLLVSVSMSRATRLLRLMMIGFEALCEEEQAGTKWGQGSVRRVFGVLTIIALTFRTLVWSEDVHQGEYLPLLCRSVQVVAVVFLYILYSQQ